MYIFLEFHHQYSHIFGAYSLTCRNLHHLPTDEHCEQSLNFFQFSCITQLERRKNCAAATEVRLMNSFNCLVAEIHPSCLKMGTISWLNAMFFNQTSFKSAVMGNVPQFKPYYLYNFNRIPLINTTYGWTERVLDFFFHKLTS